MTNSAHSAARQDADDKTTDPPKSNPRRGLGTLPGSVAGSVESANQYIDVLPFRKGAHTNAHGKVVGRTGHGEAAERMEHMVDKVMLRDARHVGSNNAPNGPDRIVDGQWIQTKYHASATKGIDSCFAKDGSFRYFDNQGNPMAIEVPKGQGAGAVRALEQKIREGAVPGVTDPAKAAEIVKEGRFTYEQAYNVARAGTIESLTYDAINGVRIGAFAGGISAGITYAHAIWNGESQTQALRHAGTSFIQVGGTSALVTVLASQFAKSSGDQALRGISLSVTKKLGPRVCGLICRAMGKKLSGAAATTTAAKLLRGNAVTGVFTGIVLTAPDLVRVARGRISMGQFAKNASQTAAGTGGGIGGYMGGAILGTAILPGAGSIIGGVVGATIGSFASSKATKAVGDLLVEDDATKMLRVLQEELGAIGAEYLLTENEFTGLIEAATAMNMEKFLVDMYASGDPQAHVRSTFEPLAMEYLVARQKIILPTDTQLESAAFELLNGYASLDESAPAMPC